MAWNWQLCDSAASNVIKGTHTNRNEYKSGVTQDMKGFIDMNSPPSRSTEHDAIVFSRLQRRTALSDSRFQVFFNGKLMHQALQIKVIAWRRRFCRNSFWAFSSWEAMFPRFCGEHFLLDTVLGSHLTRTETKDGQKVWHFSLKHNERMTSEPNYPLRKFCRAEEINGGIEDNTIARVRF